MRMFRETAPAFPVDHGAGPGIGSTIEPPPSAHTSAAPLPTIELAGARFHAISEARCVQHICDEVASGRSGWVVTMNLDHLRRFVRDREYADLCRRATLLVADGAPVVWASRIQGTPLPERVAGSNMVWSLSEALGARGGSIFFLGGDPGTAEAAAATLARRSGGLKIAGVHCPPLGFEKDQRAMDTLRAALRAAAPDVVYVALGSPKQEVLIDRLRGELPRTWWLGVGISFSFLCGRVRRAPLWMQRAGLEWVHRLAQEPRRLMKRYLVDGLPFAGALLGGLVIRRACSALRRFPVLNRHLR